MESPLSLLLAAAIAGLLTYCDLDAVFDAPPYALKWRPWISLKAWWWGFIVANGVLAAFLFYALRDKEYFKGFSEWLGALLAGAGYTALIRMTFTTLPGNIPFGLETLYQGIRNVVHRRINRIIRAWRMQECEVLARTDLSTLRERALLMVGSDALHSDEVQKSTTLWINKTAADAASPEADRRRTLALYIITERRAA